MRHPRTLVLRRTNLRPRSARSREGQLLKTAFHLIEIFASGLEAGPGRLIGHEVPTVEHREDSTLPELGQRREGAGATQGEFRGYRCGLLVEDWHLLTPRDETNDAACEFIDGSGSCNRFGESALSRVVMNQELQRKEP